MARSRRFGVAALVAAAGLLVANCRVDKLVDTPTVADLDVTPSQVTDSAAAGSRSPRVMQLSITTKGVAAAVPWTATTARTSPWLSVRPSSGTTPADITVEANPSGLAQGSHRDTILLSSPGTTPRPVPVPVELKIHPCAVTAVAPDTVVEDSLRTSDCGAPHRSGRHARLYFFTARAGDSVSIVQTTSAFRGYLIVDTAITPGSSNGSAPAPPLAESDRCAVLPGSVCLRYQLLPRSGPFTIEATSVDTARTGPFTLRINRPRAPHAPDALGQMTTEAGTSLPPGAVTNEPAIVVEAVISDPDPGDSLRLQVEAKPLGAAFNEGGIVSGAAVPSGARASVRLTGLSDGVSYHWRARAIDQTGRVGGWTHFGGNTEDQPDFQVRNTVPPPDAPRNVSQFKLDGTTAIPVGGTTDEQSVMLKATLTGAAENGALRLEVEWQPVGTPFANTARASSTAVPSGGTAAVAAVGLSDNTSYRWQARTVDQAERRSSWVAFGNNADNADFTVALPVARLVFTGQPGTTTAGSAISPAVRVAAQDAAGNTLTSFSGNVTLTFGNNPGGDTLRGTTTVKASAGVATFSDLTIRKAAQGYTLIASSPGLPSVISSAFDVQPAGASRLAFAVPPSSTTAGAAITPAVRVAARDDFGNTVTSFTGRITLLLEANPGDATLSGAAADAVSGVATFSDLKLDKAGTGYTLKATATGLTSAISTAFNVAPGPASQLVFSVQPSNVTAGAAITPAVKVTAQDGFGNTATGFTDTVTVALAANPSEATLSGTTAVPASAGVATFSNLRIDRSGTDYTLSASARGLTGATSTAFNVAAGTASRLVFTVPPGTATAGAVITPAVKVAAQDAAGNTVTSFTGEVVVALGVNPTNTPLFGTTRVNAVSGVATFSDLRIKKAATGYTLVASATGFDPATSSAFTVQAAPGIRLVFTGQPASTTAGAGFSTEVTALDSLDNTATGFTGEVTLAIADNPGGGSLSGDTRNNSVAGVASFVDLSIDKAGSGYTLAATASGLTAAKSAPFNVGTGGASRLAFSVEPPSTVTAGTAIAPAVKVAAQDALGNTDASFVGSITLTLAANPGGDTIAGTRTIAAVSGVATFADLKLHRAASGYRFQATSGTLTPDTSVAVTVTPASPSVLAFTVQPSNVVAGQAIKPAVEATVRDAYGNTTPSYSDTVRMAIGTNPGRGTLAGTTKQKVANGKAAFGNLSIDKAGNGYTLTAAATGVTGATSAAFNVSSGAATKVVLSTPPPAAARSGVALDPQPAAQLEDALGNAVSQSGVVVTAAIASGPAGAALSGATATTDESGRALFTGLTITGPVGNYTLSFAATGLTSATSGTISLSSGPATQLAITTQPSATAQSGVPFAQQPAVALRDAAGNAVKQQGVSVSAAIASGGGTLSGTTPISTDTTGVARFTNLAITGSSGSYTLGFSAPSLQGTTSNAITLTAGSATRIAINGGNNQSAPAGTAVPVPPSVIVTDASGNPVGGVAVTFAVTSGGGTVTPTDPVTTGSDGIAKVTSWVLGPTAGTNTLSATASGLQGSPVEFTATGTVGEAAVLKKVSGDSLTGPVGSTLQTPHVVQVTDAHGNAVKGIAIAWSPASGGGSVNPTSSVTDTAGRAQTTRTLGSTVGTQTTTATATLKGTPTTVTFTITATSSGASQMTIAGGDGQTGEVGKALPESLKVRVADGFNNPVPNVTVTWTVTNGGGSVSPASSTSNASGIASTSWTLGTRVEPQTVRASGADAQANFVATAKPGPADAAKSTATVPNGTAGQATTITVQAKDAFGNHLTTGGATVLVSVTGANSATPPVTDNANGTYAASYTPTVAGTDNVAITLNGSAISGSPFTSTVRPGPASSLAVSGIADPITAGASSAVTVTARDGFGNTATGYTGSVTFRSTDAQATLPAAYTFQSSDAGVKTFAGGVTLRTAGSQTVTATDQAQPTVQGSQTVTVQPGPAAAAQTTATVPKNGTAGQATSISVQARDAFGNAVTTGGATVVVTVSGANSATPAVTDNGNGTYSASYTPTVTGTDNVAITLNGSAISGSPYSSTVASAAAEPAQSTATVPNGTAGQGTVITVQAKDAFGNNVTTGGATVVVTVSGANSTTPPVTDNANGTYAASYTPTVAGTDNVAITLNGSAISGSPYTSAVSPGPAAASRTTATVPNGTAGQATVITVQAKDAFGNTVTSGGATVVVSVSGANSAMPPVSDNGNGTYGASYTPTKAGTDHVAITLNGAAINGSPYTSTVSPGAVSASQTTATVPNGTAGQATSITVQARDAFGNAVNTGGATVVVTVSGANSATPPVTDNGNGIYTASYTPTVVGTDNVAITLNGSAISGSPYSSTVSPGAASTLVFTVQPSSTTAGSFITPAVEVTALDAHGNTATGFASTVTVAIGFNPAGDGRLSGVTSKTAEGGVATFVDLNIDKAGDGYTLAASATGLTGTESTTFNIQPGVAAQLVFTVPPSDSKVDSVITPPVEITAQDAFGNRVTTFADSVTAAIGTDGSVLKNATLSGTKAVKATAGVATFPDLRIDQVGTGYTLAATSGTLPRRESPPFNVAPLE